MIQIILHTEDVAKLEATLKQFGRDAPEMFDKILSSVSTQYKTFVQKRYLSGQMLSRVTGRLWKSMRSRKSKRRRHQYIISGQPKLANIYEHPGGAVIVPVKKKWLHWVDSFGVDRFSKRVRVIQRPFMSRSSAAYDFGGSFDKSTEKVVNKELKKRGIG